MCNPFKYKFLIFVSYYFAQSNKIDIILGGGLSDHFPFYARTAEYRTKVHRLLLCCLLTSTYFLDQPVEPSFDWNHLGNVLAGLIFHDFILVFIIAAVLIAAKRICNFDMCRARQNAPKRISDEL